MDDLIKRLRQSAEWGMDSLSGRKQKLLEAADEIEQLRAAVAEATCHPSPEGCKLMNEAYRSLESACPTCGRSEGPGEMTVCSNAWHLAVQPMSLPRDNKEQG